MPILVRPVREQLEHDRVIRLLQAKYKRKFEVGINPGNEQGAPIGAGASAIYPDLILQSPERSRKLMGVVEVETGESVNNLEAMSQWASFARLRAPFHLYVPANMIDVARRLCADMQIAVAEIWTYHPVGDQIRFTMVYRSPAAEKTSRAAAPEPEASAPAPAPREPARPARRPAPGPAARRKGTSVKTAPRSRAVAAKTVPARGRASGAKKKASSTSRSARTQKRK